MDITNVLKAERDEKAKQMQVHLTLSAYDYAQIVGALSGMIILCEERELHELAEEFKVLLEKVKHF